MFVAVARLELHLPETTTLKEKRAVVRSVATRLRNQFHVAVAEVDHQDHRQIIVLGCAAVSNKPHHAEEILQAACRYVEDSRLDAEVVAVDVDVMPAFD